jgi:hypothetical protein
MRLQLPAGATAKRACLVVPDLLLQWPAGNWSSVISVQMLLCSSMQALLTRFAFRQVWFLDV